MVGPRLRYRPGSEPDGGHLVPQPGVRQKGAYRVVSGGTNCNTAATTDGCLADNWYSVYTQPSTTTTGNLANGTPDACRIFWRAQGARYACGVSPRAQPRFAHAHTTPTPPRDAHPGGQDATPAVSDAHSDAVAALDRERGLRGSPAPGSSPACSGVGRDGRGPRNTGSGFAIGNNVMVIPYSTTSGAVIPDGRHPLNATGLLGFWLKVVSEEATTTTTYDQLFVGGTEHERATASATVAAFSNFLDAPLCPPQATQLPRSWACPLSKTAATVRFNSARRGTARHRYSIPRGRRRHALR